MAENSEGTEYLGKDVFDFFGLPRELRNEIYSLLTEIKHLSLDPEEEDMHPTKAYITAVPLAQLFTLCHQFKTEYEEMFKHGLQVTFQDMGGRIQAPILNEGLDKITRAEFLSLAFCDDDSCNLSYCGAHDDTAMHIEAIQTYTNPKSW